MSQSLQRIDWLQLSITAGVILLLLGLQLRMVETFVCAPWSTQLLNDWFGPSKETAQGALQRMVVEKTEHRHIIAPAPWIGWAVLSVGFVLFFHGTWGKWRT